MAMLSYVKPNNMFQGRFPLPNDDSLEGQELNTPPPPPPPPPLSSNVCCSNLFNKLSLADAMQHTEFGPKMALNDAPSCEAILKLPILNDKYLEGDHRSLFVPDHLLGGDQAFGEERPDKGVEECDQEARKEDNASMQLRFHGESLEKIPIIEAKKKRKRPRNVKTSEEVESLRMTHIAVERNRRKQMNEHLRILRSLMPNSYVQRGDQASIIGGAIEFVRELEQLLQCLESQKWRRLYGDGHTQVEDPLLTLQQAQAPSIFYETTIEDDRVKMVGYETGLHEETAERKSCLADVEVKLKGFDGLIKIISKRRPGQLIKTIAALEDLQLHIVHTNVTTIEQTVLYSFNVKITSGEARFTAEDIANSIQQILSLVHADY